MQTRDSIHQARDDKRFADKYTGVKFQSHLKRKGRRPAFQNTRHASDDKRVLDGYATVFAKPEMAREPRRLSKRQDTHLMTRES